MTRKRLAGGLLVAALTATSTRLLAAAPADGAQSLAALVATAQHDNPELQAARYAVDIGRARLVEAGLLPNPRLELSTANNLAYGSEYSAGIGLSQEFPIAGRLLQQKSVARVDVARAQAEVEDAERKLAGEVASAVYRVLILDRQIEARQRLIEVDQHLLATAQVRYKAAEVSELDVNIASLDLQRLQQEGVVLQSERASQLVELNALLGHPADRALTIDESLPEPSPPEEMAVLQARALSARPDLRAARLDADRASAEKQLAMARRWEDWSVGVGLQQDRQVIDGAPPQSIDHSLGVNLSIPLPLWNRNQAAIAEADASGAQARSRVEALKLSIASDVATAYREALTLQKVLQGNGQTLRPVAARNVALAQQGYQQGLVTLLDVVQAQRQAAELESADLDTLDKYAQARVRLRSAVSDFPLLPASAPAAGNAQDP